MTAIKVRNLYQRNADSLDLVSELIGPLKAIEVLIRIHVISLNYRHVNILNGTNPWPVSPSGIPCSDAAGEVVEIGPDVSRFKSGDRVSPIFDQKCITGHEQTREWIGGEVDDVLATHVIVRRRKLFSSRSI